MESVTLLIFPGPGQPLLSGKNHLAFLYTTSTIFCRARTRALHIFKVYILVQITHKPSLRQRSNIGNTWRSESTFSFNILLNLLAFKACKPGGIYLGTRKYILHHARHQRQILSLVKLPSGKVMLPSFASIRVAIMWYSSLPWRNFR